MDSGTVVMSDDPAAAGGKHTRAKKVFRYNFCYTVDNFCQKIVGRNFDRNLISIRDKSGVSCWHSKAGVE